MPRNQLRNELGYRHVAAPVDFQLLGMPTTNVPQDTVILDFDAQHLLLRLRHGVTSPDSDIRIEHVP
jgi:hypothetical protein